MEEEDIDIDGEHVDEVVPHNRKLQVNNNWEERFHSHVDHRPHGPMSVGIDVSFPYSSNIYGIPEHTAPLNLPPSINNPKHHTAIKSYTEPYRLYNLDVFEYELDNTMALYGNIPFLVSHDLVSNQQQSLMALSAVSTL